MRCFKCLLCRVHSMVSYTLQIGAVTANWQVCCVFGASEGVLAPLWFDSPFHWLVV